MESKELYLVYFSEFTARFCTWAIVSQLLMHLINIHWQTSPQQLYLVGACLSLLYMSTILGGLIRDWLFTGRLVVTLGIGLIFLGCLLLLSSRYFFYSGLGLIFLGVGMVTPNTPLLLFSLMKTSSDRNFTILYGVTNAGVILGSILGGIMHEYFAWASILILNIVVIILWFVYFAFSSWVSVLREVNKAKLIQFVGIVIAVEFIVYFYLKLEIVSKALLIIAGVIYLGFLGFLITRDRAIRKSLIFSVFLIVLAIAFFSGEFQVASTFVDYAKNFVVLNIARISIPAGSLLALESIFVVLGAFIIARMRLLSQITHVLTKVSVGLFLGVLAFAVLYGSTLLAVHNPISVLWIVFAFLLFGFGDVYLMPPIMAYVTESAPPSYKGRLMAGLYFSLSLSGYFSGLIGSILARQFANANANLHFYRIGFSTMILILGIAAGLAIVTRVINVTAYLKR